MADDTKKLSGRELLHKRHQIVGRTVGRKYSPENLKRILKYAAEMPVKSDICARTGISVTSLQYYLAKSQNGHPGFDLPTGDLDENGQPIMIRFHEAFKIAFESGIEKVEREVFRRARGYDEPLSHKGRVIYKEDPEKLKAGLTGHEAYLLDEFDRPIPETIRKQDPELMQFLLKAHKPAVYGPRQSIDVTHRGGVLVVGVRAKNSNELEDAAKKLIEEPVDVEFEEIDDEQP